MSVSNLNNIALDGVHLPQMVEDSEGERDDDLCADTEFVVEKSTNKKFKDEPCPICMGRLRASTEPIPCGHSFHPHCCFDWWTEKEQQTCPLCRVEVSFEDIFGALSVQDFIKWHELLTRMEDLLKETDFLTAATWKCKKDTSGQFYVFCPYSRDESNTLVLVEGMLRLDLSTSSESYKKRITDVIEKHCRSSDISVKIVNFASYDKPANETTGKVFAPILSPILTTDDLLHPCDAVTAALVKVLFYQTIAVQYNRYGKNAHRALFITRDGTLVFNEIMKMKQLENAVLIVNKDVRFVSDTTGNPHKGGKSGDGKSSWSSL